MANTNAYADVADGDVYHEGHLYATAWTEATSAKKASALVMATRLIDWGYQFNGFKVSAGQALQWPRQRAIDPDRGASRMGILGSAPGSYFEEDEIPKVLKDATCELARELIKSDTTDAPDDEGVSQVSITGALFVQFSKKDQQPKIPKTVQMFLSRLGNYVSGSSSMARLVRY